MVWALRVVVFVIGAVICVLAVRPTWSFVLSVGGSIMLGTGALFVGIDPLLHRVRRMVVRKFMRVAQ